MVTDAVTACICESAGFQHGLTFSSSALLHDLSGILQLMASGMSLSMLGGWLDFVLMYNG